MSPTPAFLAPLPFAAIPRPSQQASTSRRRRVCQSPARLSLAPPPAPPAAPATEPRPLPRDGGAVVLRTPSEFATLHRSCAHADQALVLLFHASHCRACKAVLPKFRALAAAAGDRVVLASVLYGDAQELSMRLGVARVPVVQVWQAGDGRVDEFSCGLKSLDRLRNTVEKLARGDKYVRK